MNYFEKEIAEVAGQLRDELERIKGRPSKTPDGLLRVYALLALWKGNMTRLADVHNAWSWYMTPVNPDHPDLIPLGQLTVDKQEQDSPYLQAIHRVAWERRQK